MCLYAIRQRDKGHAAPLDTVAWKVVRPNREPYHFPRNGRLKYQKGSIHKISMKNIRFSRSGRIYHAGFHVFRTLKEARADKNRRYAECKIIRVKINPRYWMASGANGFDKRNTRQAVYSRITILD